MLKSETRIGVLPAALGQGMRRHIDMWRAKGETRVPAAIVIGAPPYVTYASCTRIPNEVCEYDVAGSLYGEPLEVTRCLTHDLLVPAESEIVIEGWVTTDELEVEGPFGEFPGYMAKRDHSYFMEITCITMRKKPIYLSIISQMPPSESSKLRHVGRNAAARSLLRKLGFDNVIDVNYMESSGSYPLVVVKLKKKDPEDTKNVLQALIKNYIGKVIIAVDDDINIYNMEHIMWAVSYRAQPYRDIEIIDAPLFSLDPSVAPSDVSRNLYGGDGSVRPRSSALVIDATMKWPYPPLSLPKREFMEGAIKLWEKLQLPELHLKDPWFGYSLGYWTDEEAEEADLAVQGRHYETGEKLKKQRRPYPL
jgi:4-hydroxy-3-polyprenylbenzoate decarboxylase